MIKKFLNKDVVIFIANYAIEKDPSLDPVTAMIEGVRKKGKVTNIDGYFIELDNNEVIAIKYITSIKSL